MRNKKELSEIAKKTETLTPPTPQRFGEWDRFLIDARKAFEANISSATLGWDDYHGEWHVSYDKYLYTSVRFSVQVTCGRNYPYGTPLESIIRETKKTLEDLQNIGAKAFSNAMGNAGYGDD